MKPKLTVIDSTEGITSLIEYLADKEYVAFDTETTGTTQHDRIIGMSVCADESEAFYVITHKWDTVNVITHKGDTAKLIPIDYKGLETDLVRALLGKKLLAHNAVFDCMMIEANYKLSLIEDVFCDTMILAHLLDENRRVGLKELAKTMFGQDSTKEAEEMRASVVRNGGKLTSKQYEMYKCDSLILAKYGAKDAWLTYRLFMELVPELYEQALDQFFFEESMPLLRGPTYELNTAGLRVDVEKMQQLKKTLEAECAEAKAFIYAEIDTHTKDLTGKFNIGSSKQLSWLLFGKIGLEFNTLTKAGKIVCKTLGIPKLPYTAAAKRHFIAECTRRTGEIYQLPGTKNGKKVAAKKIKAPWDYIQCDKKTLKKFSSKYKWVDRLLEYQRKQKLLSTYIKGVEQRIQYGIIRPSFLQHGTTSGRYASRNPNFQNLPRDDKRIKACIVARPGKVFVGADQSQLEPRVFAYYSGDAQLKAAFEGKDDFYSVIGMRVYGKTDCVPLKEGPDNAFGVKYKKLRDLSKVIALASTYGATAHQLAPTTGKSIDETQRDIDDYFEAFPGVRQYQLEMHKKIRTEGRVTNLFGRPRRLPQAKLIPVSMAHEDLPYEARNLLNLAVNHPIQCTGASIVNRAAILFHTRAKELGFSCKIVLQVHDSLVIECNEVDSEAVSLLLQDSMENAVELPGIKLEAIPKIGKTLADV